MIYKSNFSSESVLFAIAKYRIGLKAAFDLYPANLKERMQKDYKEKNWSALLQPTLAEATKKLQTLEADPAADKGQKEELEARVEVLQKMDKTFSDMGPVYDCVMWHDGTSWKAGKNRCGSSFNLIAGIRVGLYVYFVDK